MSVGTNHSYYAGDVKITIEKNTLFTGTFSDTLIKFQSPQKATLSAMFKNVMLPKTNG